MSLRTTARKNEALTIGFLLAASLGQFPQPANDNGRVPMNTAITLTVRSILVEYFLEHLGETFEEALPLFLSFAFTESEVREAFDFCVTNDLLVLKDGVVIDVRTTDVVRARFRAHGAAEALFDLSSDEMRELEALPTDSPAVIRAYILGRRHSLSALRSKP